MENLDVDELVGLLITYESRRFKTKAKSIALKYFKKQILNEELSDAELSEKRSGRTSSSARGQEESESNSWDKFSRDKKEKKYRCPRCFECSRCGHVGADCGNLKNLKESAMNTTRSDELGSDESEDSKLKKVFYMAFPTSVVDPAIPSTLGVDDESFDENSGENSDDGHEHQVAYDKLVKEYLEAKKKCETLLIDLTTAEEENLFLQGLLDAANKTEKSLKEENDCPSVKLIKVNCKMDRLNVEKSLLLERVNVPKDSKVTCKVESKVESPYI